MIIVDKQENNTIHYTCECGARGICSFKPLSREAALVINLMCPACQDVERITLLQYSDESTKRDILKNFENIDLSWVPTVNEEVLID